ncbi:hypothetical protein DER46DRAFT_159388 [Fusarium sp. MPI-SDFR-AT-0072]|nr:hypothetical protein DER46DRAFT_159388 [Fusarium sp. MPI-SDFR-AT-0072]
MKLTHKNTREKPLLSLLSVDDSKRRSSRIGFVFMNRDHRTVIVCHDSNGRAHTCLCESVTKHHPAISRELRDESLESVTFLSVLAFAQGTILQSEEDMRTEIQCYLNHTNHPNFSQQQLLRSLHDASDDRYPASKSKHHLQVLALIPIDEGDLFGCRPRRHFSHLFSARPIKLRLQPCISFLCTLFRVLDHGVVSNDGERIKNRPLRIRNLCRWPECRFHYESSQWSDIKFTTSLVYTSEAEYLKTNSQAMILWTLF